MADAMRSPGKGRRPSRSLALWQAGVLCFAIGGGVAITILLSRQWTPTSESPVPPGTASNVSPLATVRFPTEAGPCRQLQFDNRTGRIERTQADCSETRVDSQDSPANRSGKRLDSIRDSFN